MNEDPKRPILTAKMPLKNFKDAADLTPEESEWWHSFGRHLDEARKNFATIGSGFWWWP